MDVIAELEKRGLVVTYESGYEGPPEKRERVEDKARVYSVMFPLTTDEWCALCMRDGECYMGGCCGQTGAIQDHFNSLFRNSGVAYSRDVLDLMQVASRHEGFEEYLIDWSGDLEALVRDWDEHGPVQKIGICCQAVKGKLAPKGYKTPSSRKRELEDWCRILEGGLRLLSFRDLILQDGDETQKHGNREELLARILPACRKVLEEVIPRISKPFQGYAIVKGSGEIQADGFGLCVYSAEKTARSLIDLWKKTAADEKEILAHLEKLQVKPVRISAEQGIQFD